MIDTGVDLTTAAYEAVDYNATTIDGTQACIYRCTSRDQHQPSCPCQATCPDHEDHCTGCAPRPAHGTSWLCGSCYHRRLRSPLRQIPALHDWLTAQKAGLRAVTYDDDHVSSSNDHPLPFNATITDFLDMVMAVNLNGWATRVARESPPGPAAPTGAVEAAGWMEARAGWISEQPWVPLLVVHLAEIRRRARLLAPWQPTRHPLPLPCLECEQQTLVLFGGEDWVTCTNPACDAIIGWYRYQRLSAAIAELRRSEVG